MNGNKIGARSWGWRVGATGAALAILAGCGTDNGNGQPSDTDPLRIGYIQTGPFDYYVRGVDGAKAAAAQLNVTIEVFNSDGSPEKEIANVEDAISRGVDGLIVFSVGQSSLQADLAKATAANIPVAVLYGYDKAIEAQGLVFIQAPVNVTGAKAGEWMAQNVASGDVAVIQGALGRGDAEAYTDSFRTALAANPSLNVVATPDAGWDRAKAQAAMADVLTAHPGLTAVFVQNEDMAIGAVAAIKAAGKEGDVTVVSQNGSPDGLKAIENGDIAATVAWSPAEEAQMALALLVDFLRNGTQPAAKLCNTPTTVVTKDNLADAPPWVPTEASTTKALTAACSA